ncbi:MAG: hypothetical protein E7574_06275 [Ruminococcaceae bacterium]|nr:hypothetical protein [Oscillospiraceae bacterium]
MAVGTKKNKIKAMFAKSKLFSFFLNAASYLFNKAEGSITGKIFSGYDENLFEKGFIYKYAKKLQLDRRVFRPVKRTVSRLVSQSVFLAKANEFLLNFLSLGLNVYGLFFITSGIGFLLVGLFKYYSFNARILSYSELFVSALMVLISIPLLFSSSSLAAAVCKSKRARGIVFDWLGCKTETFEKITAVKGYSKLTIPVGLLLAVFSIWFSPVYLVFSLIVAVYLLAVLYVPETGIVGVIFCIPFLDARTISGLILYTVICFLLKYIRGKRTVRFDTFSICILLFSVICLLNYPKLYSDGGVIYAADSMLYGLGLFFLAVNLIKSKIWINRCIKSLYYSFFIVVLCGITMYFANATGNDYLIALFGIAENQGMVSCLGSTKLFAEYLVILLPFVLAGMNDMKKLNKISVIIMYTVGIICLFLTNEYSAWFGLVTGLVLFFVMYSKKTLAVMMFVLCVLPFVYFNLPKVVLERVSLLNRLSDYVTNVLGSVLSGVKDNTVLLFGGTGLGSFNYLYGTGDGSYGIGYRMACEIGVIGLVLFIVCMFFGLQKNTTLYSKGCSKDGRIVTLASMASVASLLSIGFDTNIFGSYKITLLFWICIGLSSCVSVTERHNCNADEFGDYIG